MHKFYRFAVKLISPCIVATVLLVSSCGLPDPVAQWHSDRESAPEEDTHDRWQKRAKQSALVVSGALVASCLLVIKVRKLCVRIVAPERVRNVTPSSVDEATLLSMLQSQQRSTSEIALLHEELAVLRKEYEEFHDYIQSSNGRLANVIGALFENDTVEALPKIISDLYKGEHAKVVRNVEGSFSTVRGKIKYFEIDAMAITNKRVLVIETKVTMKRKDVERLNMLLENFHHIRFTDPRLNTVLRHKRVHGGLSYLFDHKLAPDSGMQAKSAANYAHQHHGLLTIPRLMSNKVHPQQVEKLREFRRRR